MYDSAGSKDTQCCWAILVRHKLEVTKSKYVKSDIDFIISGLEFNLLLMIFA